LTLPARCWILLGALAGATGVAAGAFGAHALSDPEVQARLQLVPRDLETFETAVRYQMYHAPALVLAGLLSLRQPSRWSALAGWAFFLGILIFCGLLYGIVFSHVRILGAIVPLGGLSFIAGWIFLAIAGWQTLPAERTS